MKGREKSSGIDIGTTVFESEWWEDRTPWFQVPAGWKIKPLPTFHKMISFRFMVRQINLDIADKTAIVTLERGSDRSGGIAHWEVTPHGGKAVIFNAKNVTRMIDYVDFIIRHRSENFRELEIFNDINGVGQRVD